VTTPLPVLVFGIGAAISMAAVMAYSARRSRPQVRKLGPARTYYRVHVWGGLLFLALLILHMSFHLPRSGFGFILWAASIWVVVTGTLGWFLQWLVPKVLTPASSFEVNYERIPEFVNELRGRAEEVVARAEPRIQSYYSQQMASELAAPRMSAASLFAGARGRSTGGVDLLRRTLSPGDAAVLDSLCQIQNSKREVDAHYTLQRVLRGWLTIHLPVAIALVGLVVLHIFFVVYF